MAAKSKSVVNKFNCPKKLWAGFGAAGQRAYNETRQIKQSNFVHPKTKLPDDQWNTISHNMACEAAWSVKKAIDAIAVKIKE